MSQEHEEKDTMTPHPDRCNQLRMLHAQLTTRIQHLRESIQKAETEGVATPLESRTTLKSLEGTLHRIALELQGCPAEVEEAVPALNTRQGTAAGIRKWSPKPEDALVEQAKEAEGDGEVSIFDEY